MFGENLIIGEGFEKLDEKNRIFIPSFTSVEAKEELFLQTLNYDDNLAIRIFSTKEYLKIIERFKNLRNNAKNMKDFEKYTKNIEEVCKNLEFLVTTDNQKRIQLPHALITKLNWKDVNEIQYKGLGESLLVRKK